MISDEQLAEVRTVCPGAKEMDEGGVTYLYLPALKLPPGCHPAHVDGLLRLGQGTDGYTTRLFLSSAFPHKGQNWTIHHILDKTWHTFSFNGVPADARPIEILVNHLGVLR